MPVPTISDKQSVLGFRTYEAINFQPGVFTDSAITNWAATSLPTGLAIDDTTGLISGSVAASGYYVVGVVATNTTGDSAPVYFTFGILGASGVAVTPGGSDVGIDLDIDVVSREVTLAGADRPEPQPGDDGPPPLFHVKTGDVFLLNVRFKKNGVTLDPNPGTIRFALKEFDPDGRLVLSTAFHKVNSGETAYFQVPVPLTASAVFASIENYAQDQGSIFTALAELEWTQTVSIAGTTSLVSTTRTFGLSLARDLADR
jgi:hypothetical protein